MSAVASTPDAADHTAGSPVPAGSSDAGAAPSADSSGDAAGERQPIVRVRGARRARLLPAPGTSAEPAPADDADRERPAAPVASGPNDAQLLRDVPPHY
ncbi:hypothetical protein [Microbacterium sp. 1P10AE]|uniref:hypothetical protein n=1 Tax=Microbacterium sp. 1P10AE TaxID=3132286 RepID=UPI0039A2CB9E